MEVDQKDGDGQNANLEIERRRPKSSNGLVSGKSRHPKSMWRDQSLIPRELDKASGTIFDVIMPWVKEQELVEEKKKSENKQRAKSGD